MTDVQDADRIRSKMQQIRLHLDQDMDGILSHAQRALDWRYYVRRYPWGSLAAAVLAGFVLVPKPRPRVERVYLDADAARELARDDRLVINAIENVSSSPVKAMGLMAANTLLRAGIALAGQQLSTHLSRIIAGEPQNATTEDRQ